MSRVHYFVAALFAAGLGGCSTSHTAIQHGLAVSSIQRTDCAPATDLPVFRFIATRTDGVIFPAATTLRDQTTLTVDGNAYKPFYAEPFGDASRPRLTLILLDV